MFADERTCCDSPETGGAGKVRHIGNGIFERAVAVYGYNGTWSAGAFDCSHPFFCRRSHFTPVDRSRDDSEAVIGNQNVCFRCVCQIMNLAEAIPSAILRVVPVGEKQNICIVMVY